MKRMMSVRVLPSFERGAAVRFIPSSILLACTRATCMGLDFLYVSVHQPVAESLSTTISMRHAFLNVAAKTQLFNVRIERRIRLLIYIAETFADYGISKTDSHSSGLPDQ